MHMHMHMLRSRSAPLPGAPSIADLAAVCPVHKTHIGSVVGWVYCSPFISWTIVNGCMHTCWVSGLFMMQLKQVAQDYTTNEEINRWRYDYLMQGAPWSKGCFQNIIHFFNPNNRDDWTRVYDLPSKQH